MSLFIPLPGQPGKPIGAAEQQSYRLREFHSASFRVPELLSRKGLRSAGLTGV